MTVVRMRLECSVVRMRWGCSVAIEEKETVGLYMQVISGLLLVKAL